MLRRTHHELLVLYPDYVRSSLPPPTISAWLTQSTAKRAHGPLARALCLLPSARLAGSPSSGLGRVSGGLHDFFDILAWCLLCCIDRDGSGAVRTHGLISGIQSDGARAVKSGGVGADCGETVTHATALFCHAS